MARDEAPDERAPVDLNKHPLECILVPLAAAAVFATAGVFLLMSFGILTVAPGLGRLCGTIALIHRTNF